MNIFLKTILSSLLVPAAFAAYIPLVDPGTPMPDGKPVMSMNTCSKVDLTEKMGPVRTQTAGTCYAYASAELFSFMAHPKIYSAIHIAGIYIGDTGKGEAKGLSRIEGFNGGANISAMNNSLNIGLCPESALPSIDLERMNETNYTNIIKHYEASKQVDLSKECVQHISWWEWFRHPADSIDKWQHNRKIKKALREKAKILELVKKSFPGLDFTKFDVIYKIAKSDIDLIRRLIVHSCLDKLEKIDPRPQIKYVQCTGIGMDNKAAYDPERRSLIVDEINKTLEQGKPAALSFFTRGLIQSSDAKDHGSHGGAIAGRVWVEEQKDFSGKVSREAGCYYVVKNSWGPKWSPPGGLKAFGVEGKPGYFMMSEKNMLENAQGVTTYE